MGVTISTHNGSKVHREHNIRNQKVVSKEEHIDLNGSYEVWHDEKIRDAYERLFGDSVRAYNEKQSRQERKIDSYYKSVCNDAKKHPAYEMIIAVGNKENIISSELGKEIMREFVEGWSERNPNLEMIGAYYHADEQGVPHVHIDYIPVAHGYSRGMETQNGLVKALEEQGFVKQGRETAQIRWEHRENAELTAICQSKGIEVVHPKAGEKHLDVAGYKAKKELELVSEEHKMLSESVKRLRTNEKQLKDKNLALVKENAKMEQITAYKEDLEKEVEGLEHKLEKLEGKILSAKEVDDIALEKKPFSKEPKEVQKINLQDLLDLRETAKKVDDVIQENEQMRELMVRNNRSMIAREHSVREEEEKLKSMKINLQQQAIKQEQKQHELLLLEKKVDKGLAYNSDERMRSVEEFLKDKDLLEEFNLQEKQRMEMERWQDWEFER